MTPRQADVAFVLESVAGARAVFAIAPGTAASSLFDLAVAIERGGGALAEVTYALLRVLDHGACARVFLFHEDPPSIIAQAARPLVLTESERRDARGRIPIAPPAPPPPPVRDREQLVADVRDGRNPRVLIIDDDSAVDAPISAVLENVGLWTRMDRVKRAKKRIGRGTYDLVLCAAKFAFGPDGLLARLPMEEAQRVLVIARPHEVVDARRRLQGTDRILTKPLEEWSLRDRLLRVGMMGLLSIPDLSKASAPFVPKRRATPRPALGATFAALLVDLEEELQETLRRVFREDARHAMRRDPEAAAELALATPFHLVLCSANAALHPRSMLAAVARVDAALAATIVVIAPARDVPYVKHKLAQQCHSNTVLALPVEDVALQAVLFRAHPELAARLAVADVARVAAPLAVARRARKLDVLVIDDDITTQILFTARAPRQDADLTLATTALEAFEHLVTRPVDLVVVSATMRSDGGEPFYRVVWRLRPELKTRCVLLANDVSIPPSPSAKAGHSRWIIGRPLGAEAVDKLLELILDEA